MKKFTNSYVILFCLVIISRIFANMIVSISETPKRENVVVLSSSDLIEHDPILIQSDSGFISYGFDGSGTEDSPYRIENLKIDSYGEYSKAIEIRNTRAHFIIQNCYIIADYIGIQLADVATGTSKIIENTCIGRTGDGGGIGLGSTDDCQILSNNCSNFMQGIHLNHADSCNIDNNVIVNNNYQGINIRYSSSNLVSYNYIENNREHGVAIVGTGRDNLIHHNTFINNTKSETYNIDGTQKGAPSSQGYDEGYNNIWYDEEEQYGNYWSDYFGIGEYSIDGPRSAVDIYPQPPGVPSSAPLLIPIIILVIVISVSAVVIIVIHLLKKAK